MAQQMLPTREVANDESLGTATDVVAKRYDLLFLVDATASMGSYLYALNQALPQIIALSKLTNCFARIGILAYRDYDCTGGQLLEWSQWLTVGSMKHQPDVIAMARNLRMVGGRSWPEAVKTGLAKAHEVMRSKANTLVILYADAPPHFRDFKRFEANARERDALLKPGSYGGNGHIFTDWTQGARLLREGSKSAQVISVISGRSSKSGCFEYLSTVTGGACIHLTDGSARNISQITIDLLLAWMGVKKEGSVASPLGAQLSCYRDAAGIMDIQSEQDPALGRFINLEDVCFGRSNTVEYAQLTTELLERRLNKRATSLQDLSSTYLSNEHYRMLVVQELREIIETDVTTMSLNPVFGSLWRTFCNDRQNENRQPLLDAFGNKIQAIRNVEGREMMKVWLEQSYDYSAEVLGMIEDVPEDRRYPCVCLDPTLAFEISNGHDDDKRPITEFTRDELLDIGRACDWRVLKRLGKVLTRLTFIQHADDVPVHIAHADAAQLPKIPLSLARKEHGRTFWSILLHIVVPGTKLGARSAALLAALTIRLGVQPLMQPAVEQMLLWRDRWNNLEVPETWNINCLSLLIDADDAYRNGDKSCDGLLQSCDRQLFERLIDYKMLELNLETTSTAKVTWTAEHTMMPIGQTVMCKSCHCHCSVTIMAADSLCGICYYLRDHPETEEAAAARAITQRDSDKADAAWFQCNLNHCRAQYVVYAVSDLNVKPKCHYCRFLGGNAPVVECTKCLSSMIWPEEYRSGSLQEFLCVGCKAGRETIVDVETTAKALRAENGNAWLIEAKQHMFIDEIFSGQSLYKVASAAAPLDNLCSNVEILPDIPDLKLYLDGRLVQNTPALVEQLRSWVNRRRTEAGTCSLCFSDKRKNDLLPACGRSGCQQRVCGECLNGWYGLNAPGQILNTAALHCPFCRRMPTTKTLARNRSGVHAVSQLKSAVENSGTWIYGWCITCGTSKEYMERVCAQGSPDAIENWSCEECEEAKATSGSQPKHIRKECPACGVMTEKAGGCDHIECVCGAHWCFFCGKEQDLDGIYSHMSEAHGGYYGGLDVEEYESDEDD
ncbi:unnamed protein product [Cercospora beticola]|nr:unnamed protein product [Cercospora beticola]